MDQGPLSMDAGLFHESGPAPVGTRHWSREGDPRLRPRIHGGCSVLVPSSVLSFPILQGKLS